MKQFTHPPNQLLNFNLFLNLILLVSFKHIHLGNSKPTECLLVLLLHVWCEWHLHLYVRINQRSTLRWLLARPWLLNFGVSNLFWNVGQFHKITSGKVIFWSIIRYSFDYDECYHGTRPITMWGFHSFCGECALTSCLCCQLFLWSFPLVHSFAFCFVRAILVTVNHLFVVEYIQRRSILHRRTDKSRWKKLYHCRI